MPGGAPLSVRPLASNNCLTNNNPPNYYLLFAIQNLKPSPFCLLDEIEAALDDSNVGRYANYLHKLTKHTQFIVITHRRGTMAAADRLYGITMQEKGVSTLVSVDLIANDLNEPKERKS